MTEGEINKAEREVERSTNEFKKAMDHLEEAVEDGTRKVSGAVESVRETVQMPKRMAQDLKERMYQYSRSAGDRAQSMLGFARENRFQLGGVAFALLGGAVFGYLSKKREAESEVIIVPDLTQETVTIAEGRFAA